MRTTPWRRRHRRRPSARQQHRRDHAAEDPAETARDLVEALLRRRRRQPHLGEGLRGPRRGRRQARRPGARPRSRRAATAPAPAPRRPAPPAAARVPRPDLEPEMQAEHRMRPGDDQVAICCTPAQGECDEVNPKEVGVIQIVGAEELVGDARCRRRGGRAGSGSRNRARAGSIRRCADAACGRCHSAHSASA